MNTPARRSLPGATESGAVTDAFGDQRLHRTLPAQVEGRHQHLQPDDPPLRADFPVATIAEQAQFVFRPGGMKSAKPADVQATATTSIGQAAGFHPASIGGSMWPVARLQPLAGHRVTGASRGHTLQRCWHGSRSTHIARSRAQGRHLSEGRPSQTVPQTGEEFSRGAERSLARAQCAREARA
jgi:hypothetical protein